MIEFFCMSVPGGWQTGLRCEGVDYLFGPIFNKATDLWIWQEHNLPLGD